MTTHSIPSHGLNIDDLEKIVQSGSPQDLAIENDLELLKKTSEMLRTYKAKQVIFSDPILSFQDQALIFPRTINVIQGKKGQHKSRIAEYLSSVLLKKKDYEKDILDLHADQQKEYTVCHIDTERNLSEQLPYALQQIQLRAGYKIEDHPTNFEYTSLLEIERSKRFNVLHNYIQSLRETVQNHLLIVLDVLTDCVENFNDPRDSLSLIDLMNKTINEFDVTFLCVIHENPNGDKARGHLGTEIINKASLVMQVGYVKDHQNQDTSLIKISFLHSRTTKKQDPIYVQYSEEEKGLVLADQDSITENLDKKNHKASMASIGKILSVKLTEPLEKKELFELLISELEASERTLESRLKEMVVKEYPIEVNNTLYKLTKEGKGRKISYKLMIKENMDGPEAELPF